MVIEDLWKTEEGGLIVLFGLLFGLAVMVIGVFQIQNQTEKKREYELNKACGYINNSGMLSQKVQVKIICKFSTACPTLPTLQLNNVTFETEDGRRITLTIKSQGHYNYLVEGDEGILTYEGKRFVNFERKTA